MIPFKTILHPTDFSNLAQPALLIACSLARDYGARLLLLHVRPMPTVVGGEFGTLAVETPDSKDALEARLRQLLPVSYRGVAEFLVRDGTAAEEIVNVAAARTCDMIVMGTRGRSGLGRLILGSVAEAVLRRASCPVLTIKPAPVPKKVAETSQDIDELTTVSAVGNPVEADLIRNALRNEGISAYIEGATQAGLAGTLGVSIKVQVRAGDFDRASKFITAHDLHRR